MRNLLVKYGIWGVPHNMNGLVGNGAVPNLGGQQVPIGQQPGVQQQQPQGLGGNQNNQNPDGSFKVEFDTDDDDGLPEELEEILDAFTPVGQDTDPLEVNDVGLTPFKASPIPQTEVDAMNLEVKNAIKSMRFPASAIPADFDPANREQLQGLLDNVMRAAASQIMGVVYKPVSMSLGHTIRQLEGTIDSKLQIAQQTSGSRNVIIDMVPEYNMPEYQGLVRAMDAQLKQNGKKPAERAATLRKTLNTMGINVKKNGKQPGGSAPPDGAPQGSVRTGKAVLDQFFPLNLA